MRYAYALLSHTLHDEAGREVGSLWRRTRGGFLLHLEPWFEAEEEARAVGATVPRLRVLREG